MNYTKVVDKLKQKQNKNYKHTLNIWCNSADNGGEALTIELDVFKTGEKVYTNTKISAHCYGTHTSTMFFTSAFDLFAIGRYLVENEKELAN